MATAPDLEFVVMVLSIIAGLYVIYKSIRHYQMVGSKEFLLIAVFFLSITVFTAFRVYTGYISDFFDEYYGNRNPAAMQQISPLWMIVHIIWGAGIVAIIVHLLRLIEWRRRHPILKGLLLFIAVEGILEAIYYISFNFQMFYNQDWLYYADNLLTVDHYPFTNLWFFHLIPFISPSTALYVYLGIQNLLLALIYIIIKPIVTSREVKIVRVAWILFGTIVGLRWILFLPVIVEIPFFQENMSFWFTFAQLSTAAEFLEFLALTGLALAVARYPEALLITEFQVTKAAKLYQYIEDYELISRLPNLISTEKHLVNYIQSVPPEIKANIKQ